MQQNSYMFGYDNENHFHMLESALKKYNMLAFKKLVFEYYPELKKGNFLGTKKKDGTYELVLPTDSLFSKVHGDVKLHYRVEADKKMVVLMSISPEDILTEGHGKELKTYKGVMISNEHSEEDIFKIKLLEMIRK